MAEKDQCGWLKAAVIKICVFNLFSGKSSTQTSTTGKIRKSYQFKTLQLTSYLQIMRSTIRITQFMREE